MTTNEPVMVSGQGVMVYRWICASSALRFDIDHYPTKMTRHSSIRALIADGIVQREVARETVKAKRLALQDLNGYLILNGLDSQVIWSTTYPDDKPTAWIIGDDGYAFPEYAR